MMAIRVRQPHEPVVIVGAGPAGCSAAITLARAGAPVTLIDRACFPRDKVCGGCVSGGGVRRLHELLGDPLPGVETREVSFVIGVRRWNCKPGGATRMIPRGELDALLVDQALKCGVRVQCGTVADVVLEDGRWAVQAGGELLRPGCVMLACGLNGVLRCVSSLAAPRRRGLVGQQWVQPAVAPLPPLGCVELHWLRGGYVGLATPHPEHCVIALAAEAGGRAGCGPLEHLRRINPQAPVWELIHPDAPRRFGSRGSAGFPWRPRRLVDRNLILVGDAAGYEEPYTGEGIGLALASGLHATQAVLAGGDLARRYHAAMGGHRRRWRRTRWLTALLNTAFVHRLAGGSYPLPEPLLQRIIRRVHVREGLS